MTPNARISRINAGNGCSANDVASEKTEKTIRSYKKAKSQGKIERMPSGVPHPIETFVGKRLKTLRTLRGLSQSELGEAVGLTFQQIQKYERGANRIGASRLYEIGEVLDVPISYFFEDMPNDLKLFHKSNVVDGGPEAYGQPEIVARRESLEAMRYYWQLSPDNRAKIFALLKAMAKSMG